MDMHGQVTLESNLEEDCPDDDLDKVPDSHLAEYMCKARTVFFFTLDGSDTYEVECLVPLRRVTSATFSEEFIVVQSTENLLKAAPITVLGLVFVLDCLLATGCDRLKAACTRPTWRVARADLLFWNLAPPPVSLRALPHQWNLKSINANGQTCMTGMSHGLMHKRLLMVPNSPVYLLHPWQAEPPLPFQISIDLSNHTPPAAAVPCRVGGDSEKWAGLDSRSKSAHC